MGQGLKPHRLVVAPGSQKGCRRQEWHTAGWVGAGSQLGPERVVKLAGLGERVSAVSALSHVCNCDLRGPLPSTPLPQQWR